jgi:ribosome-binding ATPase YchF (GTP1/OBG family)
LDRVIRTGYDLLGLITYFTSGEMESRAWTITRGMKAPQAAGVIHTDFVKGFVKADVCNWQEFVACKGWPGVRESGKLRLEGKEYVFQDGDVCYFHIA